MVNHIGFIMDGNRRYARKRHIPQMLGHKKGCDRVKSVLNWCRDMGVKEITLYTFSMQNFNRDMEEVNYLMQLFKDSFADLKNDSSIHKNKIRINFIGRIGLFPDDVQKEIKSLMESTKDYDNFVVNFALGYGGREEITDACKKIAVDVKEGKIKPDKIDEKLVSEYLYMSDEPELIIRTGGEQRTSNFLPWQSSYSEWFFTDKFWPEIEKEDIALILEKYGQRERRFGK